MIAKPALGILKETFQEFGRDKVPRLAAALAYFTLFSLAPLLVIAIAVAGLAFGEEAARGEVVDSLRGLLGPKAADGIETMIQNSAQQKDGVLATILGIVTLLFGASGVFGHLKDTLNTIWGVEEKKKGFVGTLKERFLSFSMVLGVGFLLLVSLVVSAGLSAAGKFFSDKLPLGETVWQIVNFGISLAVITLLFAAIFKFVPDTKIEWSHVWTGAAFTSLLFALGKVGIGIYLGKSALTSTYGAGASLVILLLWLYYSSLILFFGAEFTEVWARSRKGATGRGAKQGTEKPGWSQPTGPLAPAPAAPGPSKETKKAARARRVAVPVAAGAGGLVLGIVVGIVGTLVKVVRSIFKLVWRR